MLTQKEEYQLNDYCKNDAQLALLISHLKEAHRMELSQISHEIRNPVTLINSFLQLTESQHPEVAAFSSWQPLMENMDYLKLLLEELSDYNNSRLLHKELFSLNDFLKSLVCDCQALTAPIPLIFEKQTAIPPSCFDKTKLRSALLNLIRNAVESLNGCSKTPGRIPLDSASRHSKITLSISFDGDFFHINVSNNGPMISPEDLPSLFTPFVTHKKEGTGLGLAIVKNIAEAHGGSVSVASTAEETCFSLHLPLCYEDSPAT
ncbi:MAG: HAMP domain-containing histidine kinase [Clostridia bacterium]|nr:HAMP domain-containing histidine kinase [Clostridia bacterium]NCC43579.1 HAMP domain-containing histidine kinase [Clostridia bacterium]